MSEMEPESYYERTNRMKAENERLEAENMVKKIDLQRTDISHNTTRFEIYHFNFRKIWVYSCATFLLAEFMALVL